MCASYSQKDIPLANYTIHEIHCSRNIGICPICKESFPKAEMRTHREQDHAQVTKPGCLPLFRWALAPSLAETDLVLQT